MVPARGWGQGRCGLAPGRRFAVLSATAACHSGGAGTLQALKSPLVGLGAGLLQAVGALHLHCRCSECWQGHASPWPACASTHGSWGGHITHWAGAEALCGDSLCLRCLVPAGLTPPEPPLLLPWGAGITGMRGPSLQGVRGSSTPGGSPAPRGPSGTEGALALLGKGRAVPRDKAPPGPRTLLSLAATEELGTRGAGRALVSKCVCRRNRLRAPAAEPRSMATPRGLIFLVTAWQPEVI